MAKNPALLNKKQVEVLEWIRSGSPEGIYTTGYQHRIIARALERRGLVDISGKGPTWTAATTEAGQAWQDGPPQNALAAEAEADGVITEVPENALPTETEAEKLIARVLKTDGRLVLPEDRDVEKVHERLVHLSLKSPARPREGSFKSSRPGNGDTGRKQSCSPSTSTTTWKHGLSPFQSGSPGTIPR